MEVTPCLRVRVCSLALLLSTHNGNLINIHKHTHTHTSLRPLRENVAQWRRGGREKENLCSTYKAIDGLRVYGFGRVIDISIKVCSCSLNLFP